MNLDKIKNKSLEELFAIKTVLNDICDDYAKTLTTYASVNYDPQFTKMDIDTKKIYEKRGRYVSMLGSVKSIIEDKVNGLFDE